MKPKFKINDLVIFSATNLLANSRNKTERLITRSEKRYYPQLFSITDINTETCYGGTQIHYSLRAILLNDFDYKQIAVSTGKSNDGIFIGREMEIEKYELD